MSLAFDDVPSGAPAVQAAGKCYGVVVASHGVQARESVALVSDRRLSVAALAALMMQGTQRVQVDAAQGVPDVQRMLEDHSPHVGVMDFGWPWTAAADVAMGGIPLLLLLDPTEEAAAFSAARVLGPQGYLSRTASSQALKLAITALRTVGTYLDPVLAGKVLSSERNSLNGAQDGASLSARELEILVEIASGRSSKEIAREYEVTAKTICNHVSNIYTKLNLRHRGQLVLYAAQQGIALPGLPPPPAGSL